MNTPDRLYQPTAEDDAATLVEHVTEYVEELLDCWMHTHNDLNGEYTVTLANIVISADIDIHRHDKPGDPSDRFVFIQERHDPELSAIQIGYKG